jgi:hypothetical protein
MAYHHRRVTTCKNKTLYTCTLIDEYKCTSYNIDIYIIYIDTFYYAAADATRTVAIILLMYLFQRYYIESSSFPIKRHVESERVET